MMDRLTVAELATMRAEHVPCERCMRQGEPSHCRVCFDDNCIPVSFPCSTARLLKHFAPGPVPHLAATAQVPIQQINHCHCGVDGMEMSHPRHAPTSEQQAAIGSGLLGPAVESELS